MANKEQLKSTLVSLGSLALKVRDRLSESHDQGTYANLLDEIKQSISNVEEITAALAEEMSEVNEAEVYASVSDARSWQIKLMGRVNFLKSFSANVNANVNVNVVVSELTVEINPIHPIKPLINLTKYSSFIKVVRIMTKILESCQSPANPFEKLV